MSNFFNETIEQIALTKDAGEKLRIFEEAGGFLALKEDLIKGFSSSKSTGMLDIFALLTEEEILELVMQPTNNQLAVASLLELKTSDKIKSVALNSDWANVSRFAVNMIGSIEELENLKLLLVGHKNKEMLLLAIEEKISDIAEFLKRSEALEVEQVEISIREIKEEREEKIDDKIEEILNNLEIKSNETESIDEALVLADDILEKLPLIKTIEQDKMSFVVDMEREFANLQKKIDIRKLSVEDIHKLELVRKQIRLAIKFINWQLSIESKFKEVVSVYESGDLEQYAINQLADVSEASDNIHNELLEFVDIPGLAYLDFVSFEILRQKYGEDLENALSIKKENLAAHIQQRIDDLQDKIDKGNFSQIEKKINNVEFRLKILDKTLANKFALRLKELKAEVLVKKDLHNKAAYPKQEELCKQLEAMLANTELTNIEIMKALSHISKEWQELSKGLDKQIYWYRFNEAKKALIERCQVYIRQSSDIRKENSRKRALLVADLLSFVENLDKDKIIIDELIEKKSSFWKSWTAARPFIAEVGTELKDNFKQAMDILEGYLKDFYNQNYNKKVLLVEAAKELVSLENHKDAIRRCIKLQLDWKSVGNAGVHESKLWKEFRESCNEIFQKGDRGGREIKGERVDKFNSRNDRATNNASNISSEKVKNISNQLEGVFVSLSGLFDTGVDRSSLLERFILEYPAYKQLFINIQHQMNLTKYATREEFIGDLVNIQVILNLDSTEPSLDDKKKEVKLKLLTDNHIRNLLPIEKLSKLKEKIIAILAATDSSVISMQKELAQNLGKFVHQNNIKLF